MWQDILDSETIPHVIKPSTWGPSLWTCLHCFSLSYPLNPSDEDKAAMHRFFHAMKNVLPCGQCKSDFTLMMERDPIEHHLHSRESLCRWVNEKHNQVNRKTNSPTMTFEDSVTRWTQPQIRPMQRGAPLPVRLVRTVTGAQAGQDKDASCCPQISTGVAIFLGLILFFAGIKFMRNK